MQIFRLCARIVCILKGISKFFELFFEKQYLATLIEKSCYTQTSLVLATPKSGSKVAKNGVARGFNVHKKIRVCRLSESSFEISNENYDLLKLFMTKRI